jgi:hypothetical protein
MSLTVPYHGDDDIYLDGNAWANVKVAGQRSGDGGRGLRSHMSAPDIMECIIAERTIIQTGTGRR